MEYLTGSIIMGVQKQSVSFTDAAYAYAKDLVARGDYPTISAAVSGELARARSSRDREQALLEAEVRRRLEIPLDQWVPLAGPEALTADAFARIEVLEREAGEQARG